RDKIFNIEKEKAIDYFNFDLTKKTLLIFGGSQGALSINKAVLGIYKLLTKNQNLQLIHLTGKKNYKNHLNLLKKNNINIEKYKNIKVISYLEHMEYAYAISDLVISRAGATGLAEITASALAAILIPYPYATGNHQYYNAKILENKGAAKVIKEKDLNEDLMLKEFKDIIYDKEKLKEMSLNSKKLAEKNATQKIIKEIENIVK
ncbi:MAG: UDP-N-acetylglucosamine--N-acetylmuramyl-(pentapeptide) pyrophosphoryl-undecaprenol N-acetylglucosamine transferase, partial [Bacillota bacterium]